MTQHLVDPHVPRKTPTEKARSDKRLLGGGGSATGSAGAALATDAEKE